jgi:SAM-dependent methyltransferase
MAWAWVRPVDRSVLEGRPLLDLGTGDGQTLDALVVDEGLVVAMDREPQLLRPGSVNAVAHALPFSDGSFAVVLAADLFHHLDDAGLASVLAEIGRVLRSGGRLVAWWYAQETRPAADAPRFPRPLQDVLGAVRRAGFAGSGPLELAMSLESTATTVGLVAQH